MEFKILLLRPVIDWHMQLAEQAVKLMQKEGTFTHVFYDGLITNQEQACDLILNKNTVSIIAFDQEGQMAGLAWINNLGIATGQGHFVFFKKFWGRKKTTVLGRTMFEFLLLTKDNKGYIFDCLLGITPIIYPLATRKAIDCGAALIGTVPNYCYMKNLNKNIDAVAVSVTRKSLGFMEGI